jgi:hypothetical protein
MLSSWQLIQSAGDMTRTIIHAISLLFSHIPPKISARRDRYFVHNCLLASLQIRIGLIWFQNRKLSFILWWGIISWGSVRVAWNNDGFERFHPVTIPRSFGVIIIETIMCSEVDLAWGEVIQILHGDAIDENGKHWASWWWIWKRFLRNGWLEFQIFRSFLVHFTTAPEKRDCKSEKANTFFQ